MAKRKSQGGDELGELTELRDIRDYLVDLSEFTRIADVGQGAQGTVWKGRSQITGWTVAVKEILQSKLEAQDLEFFQREIQILARCNDPFLLEFFGFTASPPYCIVTSFMPGGSLWDALHHQKGSLNPTQKTNIALGMAHGMKYLHSHKIVHRDFKSPNVLLDDRKLPKIADFGLGRFVTDCSAAHKMTGSIGTPSWMAPELLENRSYGTAVDVYAFGIILYEMYTEKIPYEGLTQTNVCANVVAKGLRPELPERESALSRLIQQCWDQDPSKRPTFDEIYNRFESHAVSFGGAENRGIDILIHEIHQHEEIINNAITAAATNLNDVIALRKEEKSPAEITALLIKSAREGDLSRLTKLVAAYREKADLNSRDPNGVCPLHAAVIAGQLLVVQYLLKLKSTNKNIQDSEGNTPLMAAVKFKQVRIAGFLVQWREVDVNAQNHAGQTALHILGKLEGSLQQGMAKALAVNPSFRVDITDKQKITALADKPELLALFQNKKPDARKR
jgi:serine/threonine protein kinase